MFSDLDTYNTINADTEQGSTFLEYKQKYATASGNNHYLLSESSSPNLGSIVEAVDGTDSVSRNKSATQTNLTANQKEFNDLLSKYSLAYNGYILTLTSSSDNSESEAKLQELNNQLITKAQTIVTEMNSLNQMDNTLSESNQDTKSILVQRIKELKEHQDKLNGFNKNHDSDSIDGKLETSALSMNSIYYHYIVYFFIGLTLIGFIFYISMNPNADIMKAVFLLIALSAVYIISRWVNR
jgi:hypothetical protein